MKTTYRPMNNIKLLSLKKEEKILLLIIHWKQKKYKRACIEPGTFGSESKGSTHNQRDLKFCHIFLKIYKSNKSTNPLKLAIHRNSLGGWL